MISRIPSLDFIRSLAGTYKTADGVVELRIERIGYGASLTLSSNSKMEFAGVVGAAGQSGLECYAQVGLPNLVRLVGGQPSDHTLQLASEEVPIDLLLAREGQDATATARFGGKTGTAQVMRLQAEDGQAGRW